MSIGARGATARTEGDAGEDRTAKVEDLMDPAALEARLSVARARRAEVLAQKRKADPARADGAATPRPADLPPEALMPLSKATPAAGGRRTGGGRADGLAPARPPGEATRQALSEARAPAEAGPERAADVAPAPSVEGERASRAAPVRRGWTGLAVTLLVGLVAGVGGTLLLLAEQGWQLTVVPPQATPSEIPASSVSVVEAPTATPSSDVPDERVARAPSPGEEAAALPRGADAAALSPLAQPSAPSTASAALPAAPASPSIEIPEAEAVATEGVGVPETPDGTTVIATLAQPERPELPDRTGDLTPWTGDLARGDFVVPAPRGSAPEQTAEDLPRGAAPATSVPAAPELSAPAARPPGVAVSPLPAERAAREAPLALDRLQVVLHHPPDAAETAQAAARAFSEAGVSGARPQEVAVSISAPNVRYFHEADQTAAREIAATLERALGEEVAARSFTDFRPSPAEGLIEVWLAGEAPAPATASASASASASAGANDAAAAAREAQAAAARERLVRSIETRLRQQLR